MRKRKPRKSTAIFDRRDFLQSVGIGGSALLLGTRAGVLTPASPDEASQLLNPRALPAKAAPESEQELRKDFVNPPAEYRSMPLWTWNDQLEWPRLKDQLFQFKQQGMGGVFIHPRPGLMSEYLGEDWFRLWRLSVEEGKRLGLFINIYDENSYPSGFAGGHVASQAPDTVTRYVQADLNVVPGQKIPSTPETIAVFAIHRDAEGKVDAAKVINSPSELPGGYSAVVFRLRTSHGIQWLGGFPYVDLTDPQATRTFITTTFEAYKRYVGNDFGRTVRWSFADEPNLDAGHFDEAPLSLPLSYLILAEFRNRNGYDLPEHLASLYWDVGDHRKVRFDYWQTLHDLWKENYFRPIFLWCDQNNIQFTGHWCEHEWPDPTFSPADASFYAYQHVPGIDMLAGSGFHSDSQGWTPEHYLFTIKQVASVAHQLGRRALCETYGASGWDSTLEFYKRYGDWLMVHGINFINQHLSFVTVRGARKRDAPQSFSDVSSWWRYYRLHGDYLGRVCYMLSRGRVLNRLLLLEATTSGFLWSRRMNKPEDASAWRTKPAPELIQMRKDNGELIQYLTDHQVDFDLGDEYIIEWFGKIDGRKFVIGRAPYELIVWPKGMINVRHQTVPILEQYLAAGGEILALSPPAPYVDGRPSDRVAALRDRFPGQWHFVSELPDLLREVRLRLRSRVSFDRELPSGVGVAELFLENGDRVIFFANSGLGRVTAQATVEGRGLEDWDPATGRIMRATFGDAGPNLVRINLELPPAGSRLLLVSNRPETSAQPKRQSRFTRLDTRDWRIVADSPNVLVLDTCDLALRGSELRDVGTYQANWKIWQAHGFERPAWENAGQFKTGVFDRNHFPPSSGFEATFRFAVADAVALNGLQLAVESPELYRVTLNGNKISFENATRWLDPHLWSVAAEKWAKVGVNMIKIVGRPFDVRMELENIYVRGNFEVLAQEKGFHIVAPKSLKFGDWTTQGYPFYGDSVLYQTEVLVPSGSDRMKVDLGKWEGSVAEVLSDGERAAVVGWQPYTAEFPVNAGKHTVAVRVASTPTNVFGPYGGERRPIAGLMAPPTISAAADEVVSVRSR